MKGIYVNMVKGGLLGAVMLLGATSCSDDHFDVKSDASGASSLTIWQHIEQNQDLSEFAAVLKQARVMTKEDDTKSVQTFAEFLDQPQTLTVWAPKNGSFDPQYYLDILQQAETLRASDPRAAAKLEYTVTNRFVNNHLARFNYEFVQNRQQVRMMNSKNCYFSAVDNTFNGVPIVQNSKTISSNGVMHVLENVSPFADNIFDYLASNADVSTVYGIISDPSVDKSVFSPELSTEGTMNDNAEMVYVDSVYVNTNTILDRAGALIKNEDSLYIAIIPTNAAWDGAVETVSPLFDYGTSYCYDWSSDENKFLKTGNNALKFNTDSLQEVSTRSNIIMSMFFNPTEFKNIDKTDSEALLNYFLKADSLESTNGYVFYNKAGAGNLNPMLEGVEPVRASNGYIFPVPVYNIDPNYSFIPRIKEIKLSQYALASVTGCNTEWGETVLLTSENRNDDIVGAVDLEDDTYYYFRSSGGRMNINVPLRGLASGHYKISVVMLPNKVYASRGFDANGDPKVEEPIFSASIMGDDNKRIGSQAKDIEVNQDAVEKVVLWEDFELGKSYHSLPDGYDSFPYLQISVTAQQMKKGNFEALSIKSIVIEPVR